MKLRWGKAGSRAKKASSDTVPTAEAGKERGRHGDNGNSTAGGFGSEVHEEDVFFDPRPWPESDGEDDFYSVNGELTPSRVSTPSRSCGSTPKHHDHSLSPRTASNNGCGASATDPDARANPEEATPRTRFGTLLKRTKRGAAATATATDGGGGSPMVPATNGNGGGLPPKCSGDGNRRTRASNGELGNGGGKKSGGMGLQCCLPGLGCSKRRQHERAVENSAVP